MEWFPFAPFAPFIPFPPFPRLNLTYAPKKFFFIFKNCKNNFLNNLRSIEFWLKLWIVEREIPILKLVDALNYIFYWFFCFLLNYCFFFFNKNLWLLAKFLQKNDFEKIIPASFGDLHLHSIGGKSTEMLLQHWHRRF